MKNSRQTWEHSKLLEGGDTASLHARLRKCAINVVTLTLGFVCAHVCACDAASQSKVPTLSQSGSSEPSSQNQQRPSNPISVGYETPATAPLVSGFTEQDFVASTNRFGIGLYAKLAERETQGNFFVASLSLYRALAALREGAASSTALEMDHVLGLPSDSAVRRRGLAQMNQALDSNPVMKFSTRIFLAEREKIVEETAKVMRSIHGVYAVQSPFLSDPERSIREINEWVSEQTDGKIPNFLRDGDIGGDVVCFLANTMLIKAEWENLMFQVEGLRKFQTLNGAKIDTKMMHTKLRAGYMRDEELGLQLVELPFASRKLSALVILPDSGQLLHALNKVISADVVAKWLTKLGKSRERLDIEMPIFAISSRLEDLIDILREMGIHSLFSRSKADLSLLVESHEQKWVDRVMQETRIRVDEKGTEIAAASGIRVRQTSATSGETKPIHVVVDRPFLFFVVDRELNLVVLSGQVSTPN